MGKTPAICLLIFAVASAAAQQEEEELQHSGPVTDIRFRKNHPVAGSQAGAILHQRKSTIRMGNPAYRLTSIAVSRDDGYFHWFYAGGIPGESGNLSGLRDSTGKWTANLKIADDLVYSMEAHQGVLLALADGRVLHLENTNAEPKVIHQHTAPARSVRVSPDRHFVASGGLDRLIFVSKGTDVSDENPVTLQDHTGPVECLAFSPDSTLLASGARDGKVRIHSVPDGKLVRTYSHLDGEVSAIAWSETHLLAGTSRGKIHQLDPANDSSSVVADWGVDSPITALAIGPDEKVFAGTLNRIDRVKISD